MSPHCDVSDLEQLTPDPTGTDYKELCVGDLFHHLAILSPSLEHRFEVRVAGHSDDGFPRWVRFGNCLNFTLVKTLTSVRGGDSAGGEGRGWKTQRVRRMLPTSEPSASEKRTSFGGIFSSSKSGGDVLPTHEPARGGAPQQQPTEASPHAPGGQASIHPSASIRLSSLD